MTGTNPRCYPDTLASPESGRPMRRGEKEMTLAIAGRTFTYMQPGWWCSLTDPDDMDGQLVDEDNVVAEMARRTAKVLARGESVFVPVVIRALRERLRLSQREAGAVFGTGEKSFEKYESGEISPSGPTRRLLKLAMERPDLFEKPEKGGRRAPSDSDESLARKTLRDAAVDRFYERLFAGSALPATEGAAAPPKAARNGRKDVLADPA